MIFSSLTDRILFFFCALLILVQLIVFSVVDRNNRQINNTFDQREKQKNSRIVANYLAQVKVAHLAEFNALVSNRNFINDLKAGNRYEVNRAVTATNINTVNTDSSRVFALYQNNTSLRQGFRIGATAMPLSNTDLEQLLTLRQYNIAPSEGTITPSEFYILQLYDKRYSVMVLPVPAKSTNENTIVTEQWLVAGFELGSTIENELQQLLGNEVRFSIAGESTGTGINTNTNTNTNNETTNGAVIERDQYLLSELFAGDVILAANMSRQSSLTNSTWAKQRTMFLLLIAASLVVSLLAGYAIAHEITKPLKLLNRAAQKIGAGDYDQTIDISQRDEVGQLADSLRSMCDGVSEREEKILQLAYSDTLTNLPNRAMFHDRLNHAVNLGKRTDSQFTVLMLDLDRFKYINDVLGHESGDSVLQEVAKRLQMALRESDTVARLGGDEFAILLQTGNIEQVKIAAHKITAAMEAPVILNNQPIDISCSIGIANFPDHGTDSSLLLRRADVAMYSAKRINSGYAFYDLECEEHQQEHLSLLGEIKRAVDANEFELFYQPKMCFETATSMSVETLLRWQHPERGLIPPDDFIPFAEHTGAIRLITAWVIEHAIAQCGEWISQGMPIKMSLNVSARDLLDPNLPNMTRHALSLNNVPASSICFEITESALMEDPKKAKRTIEQLSEIGIDISIDDYGTGYSSLAYVKKLPVNELKIDREFVKNMTSNKQDIAIVRSTIELGHNLGMKVVAEGIENQEEMDMLKTLGCDHAQGFLISEALNSSDLEDWIKEQNLTETIESNSVRKTG